MSTARTAQAEQLDLSESSDSLDPGDEVQRNFRYQHAYGAILLIGATAGRLSYVAVWCEHHEDLLGERTDGTFDCFQVKTRSPGRGAWTIGEEGWKGSLKRFVRLVRRFGDRIHRVVFVSDTPLLDVGLEVRDRTRLSSSPAALLRQVNGAQSASELTQPFDRVFRKLLVDCRCTEDDLFRTLKRMTFQPGPSQDGIDAVLSHDHLPLLPECANLPRIKLNGIRDELIQRVYFASSLRIQDPARHYYRFQENGSGDPVLRAKRIAVDDVHLLLRDSPVVPFRFYPGAATVSIGQGRGNIFRLNTKMIRGGLSAHFVTMQRRALSAEEHLMEIAHRAPEEIDSILDQLESVVQGECDDADLHAVSMPGHFGSVKLLKLQQGLKFVAEHRPDMVYHQPYECLIGLAGLLSGECKVWWSEPFDLGEVA